MKRQDVAISYVRFIAMIMIIICHFFQYYGNELAFWFNVGVQIFFVISGFLYGSKDIDNPIDFICKQFKKILIPYYVFIIFITFFYLVFARTSFSLPKVVKAVFCVGTIDGLGHLWFIGYILICYIMTPYLYWLRKKAENYSIFKMSVIYIVVCFLVIAVGVLTDSYFQPHRICCYMVGFMIASYHNKYGDCALKCYRYLFGIFALVLNALRIYLKYVYNVSSATVLGKVFMFSEPYLHLLLGVAIFLWLHYAFSRIRECSLVRWSNKYSFCIYIVHQTFILSPFSTMSILKIAPLNWMITIMMILVCGMLLHFITECILRKILIRR